MIRIYCRARHGVAKDLCEDCAALFLYAQERIEKCPFGLDKPVCNQCTIHCYESERRERIKSIMRYAGPRMIVRHPVLALRHFCRARYLGGRSK